VSKILKCLVNRFDADVDLEYSIPLGTPFAVRGITLDNQLSNFLPQSITLRHNVIDLGKTSYSMIYHYSVPL
jgi:hypothetical protein